MRTKKRKRIRRVLSMLMTAALLFTGVNFPEVFGLEPAPTAKAADSETTLVRSLADPKAINKFKTSHLTMYDIIQKYNNVEWRFGENWSGNPDQMLLTQARKYQYDRKTKTPASWQAQVIDGQYPKGETVQIQGNKTISENNAVQNLVALDTSLVGHDRVYFQAGTTIPLTGETKAIADDGALYHYYDLELPRNVQIPISKWVVIDYGLYGVIAASHYESMPLAHGAEHQNVVAKTSRTMIGNPWGYLLYDDDGDGVYHRDGQWAYYKGIEFHADGREQEKHEDDGYNPETGGYDSIEDNYQVSPCFDQFLPNITYDYSPWAGFCAFCGQPINASYNQNGTLGAFRGGWAQDFLFYASKESLSYLPVVNTGREIMLECGICGGMDQSAEIGHTCTGISPNIFQVRYDANGGYGYAPTTTWLTNFETEYEGNPIHITETDTSKTVNSGSGLQREGYTFKGWSFRSDGTTVDVVPGVSLLALQNNRNGEHDAASHTTTFQLFAVWEPDTNAVVIDAQAGNTLAGTASFKNGQWNGYTLGASSTQATFTSKKLRESIDVVINETNTNYPSGYQVSFSAVSDNGSGTGTNLQYASQKGSVSAVNVSLYGTGSGGFKGTVTDTKANADGSLSFRYTFGTGELGSGGYAGTPDRIDILYSQGEVTLPSITPPAGKDMIGWFTKSGQYVGMPGDSYPSPFGEDETLYPRFSEFKLEIEDVYYESTHTFGGPVKTAAGLSENGDEKSSLSPAGSGNVKYGTGAVNLKLNITSSPVSTDVYKLEGSTDKTTWTEIAGEGTSSQAKLTSWKQTLSSAGTEITIPQTGFYRVTAYGANGTDYNTTYKGGKGGKVSGVFFFRAGDIVRANAVGKVGGGGDVNPATTAKAANGTTLLKGGSYTQVIAYESGNKSASTELMIAGGGGAGSKTQAGGDAGGSGTNASVTGSVYNGGGAIYVPKVVHVHHNHTLAGCTRLSNGTYSCGITYNCTYHEHSGNATSGGGCYNLQKTGPCGAAITQFDVDEGDCNKWWDPVNNWCTRCHGTDPNAHVHFHNVCARGHQTWSRSSCDQITTVYGLNCAYKNSSFVNYNGHSIHWTCTTPDTPESSQRGTGGANRIQSNLSSFVCQSPSAGVKGASDSTSGSVVIEVVNAGFLSAKSNTVTILGYAATDHKAPQAVKTVLFEADRDNGRVSWTAAENPRSVTKGNSTPYYFRASWYRATASGMVMQKQTDICEADIVSGIAGYYYICNNTESYDIASNISGYKGPSSYTWTNNHAGNHSFIGTWAASSYMDGGQKYYYVENVCDNAKAGQSYFHVAPVDTAGNIGPTTHIAIEPAKDPDTFTGAILFDRNAMQYQDGLDGSITMQKSSGQENVEGYNVIGYYFFTDGTKSGSKAKYVQSDGTLKEVSYGGTWPIVNAAAGSAAYMASFTGWNSSPDGTGVWYSQNGSGTGSGVSPANAKKLTLSDVIPGYEANKTDLSRLKAPVFRLYAIYGETTQIEQAAMIQVSTLDPKTGAVTSSTKVLQGNNLETPWTNAALFRLWGDGLATRAGRYQEIFTGKYADSSVYTGQRLAAITAYPGTYTPKSTLNGSVVNGLSLTEGDLTLSRAANKTFGVNGQPGDRKTLLDTVMGLQGTIQIESTAYSKQYQETMLQFMQGWGSGTANGSRSAAYSALMRLDLTPPSITGIGVTQRRLDDYKEADVRAWASGSKELDLTTTFTIVATDYNDSAYGDYTTLKDSSGLYGVFVTISDSEHPEYTKTYPCTLLKTEDMTSDGSAPVRAQYSCSVDTYLEFPESSTLTYQIHVLDHAGNKTKDPNTVRSDLDPHVVPADHEGSQGILTNFSIKTVFRNDTNPEFNVGEGMTYFFTGQYGHVDVWTVGFLENIEMDFGEVGLEMIREMEDGRADTHNMGAGSCDEAYKRMVSWEKGSRVEPGSLRIYNQDTGTYETIQKTDPRYAKAMTGELFGKKTVSIPYANYYTVTTSVDTNGVPFNTKWDDQGTSQRIPLDWKFEKGTDGKSKVQVWNYIIYGYKGTDKIKTTSFYVLCEPGEVDLHYRVIHES